MSEIAQVQAEWIGWDTYEIIKSQIEFLKEEGDEDFLAMSEAEQFNYVAGDQDLFQWQWEDLLGELDDWVEELNPNHWYTAKVFGFGWRKLDGTKDFYAKNAKEFLREVLPDCECTFKSYREPGLLRIQNSHHDAPARERYEITALQEEYDETEN